MKYLYHLFLKRFIECKYLIIHLFSHYVFFIKRTSEQFFSINVSKNTSKNFIKKILNNSIILRNKYLHRDAIIPIIIHFFLNILISYQVGVTIVSVLWISNLKTNKFQPHCGHIQGL